MGNKKSLEKANRQKYDEYYTLYQDIADEVPHYRDQLRGKRILCPCDWDESFDEIFVYKAEAPRKTDLFGEGAVRIAGLLGRLIAAPTAPLAWSIGRGAPGIGGVVDRDCRGCANGENSV